MENIEIYSKKQREELFRLTASKKGIIESLVEKDFWVCFVLKSILESGKLKDILIFKDRFYRSPSARYELAKPGTLKIVPSENKISSLQKDYEQMKEMLFGNVPTFDEIISSLKKLEVEINT
jgi:hypothetical protein